MYKVYVSGKMTGLVYEDVMARRQIVSNKLYESGMRAVDPVRGCADLSGKEFTDDTVPHMNEIVQRDLHDVDSCDALLVLTGDDLSWGTTGEFWYATFVAKKPTVVIATNGLRAGWLNHHATRVVSDETEAVEVLKNWSVYW